MRIDLAVVCDHAALTIERKPLLVGIFDNLNVPKLPWQYPHMVLVFRLRIEGGEAPSHDAEVRFIDPDGKPVLPVLKAHVTASNVDAAASGAVWAVFELNGVTFKSVGDYRFDLLVDGMFEESVDFVVRLMPPQPNV